MLLRRGLLAAGCLAVVACGSGSGSPAPSATAAPTPAPTPTLDPHALLQKYVTELTADIHALPQDVKAQCAQGVDPCGRALDAVAAIAQKGIADLQALPAEPASAMQAVEDIRNNLRFTLGLGGNVRSGQNSPADDGLAYDNIHHQLVSDLTLLAQQAQAS